MYGWRAKIGQIIPSVNTCTEPQMQFMAPENIALYSTRLTLRGASAAEIAQMSKFTEQGAELLGDAQVDLIIFYCTAGSFIGGEDLNQQIVERIEKTTNIPAITTATSVVNALETLQLKKVTLVTPYPKEINKAECDFLAIHGVEVTNQYGMELVDGLAYASVEPGTWYRIAKETDSSASEGILFSCTNTRVVEIIDALEKDTKKPVVTSNQATLWYALRKLGINEKIDGYGTLMAL